MKSQELSPWLLRIRSPAKLDRTARIQSNVSGSKGGEYATKKGLKKGLKSSLQTEEGAGERPKI